MTIDVWPDDADPRWRAAVLAFTRHHDADPREVVRDGVTTTASIDYHARVSAWVRRLDPHAPLPVRLAALAQHVRRFELPRSAYPSGPQGYKRWRAAAGLRHAEIAREVMTAVGYDEATISHTCDVMLKKKLAHDPAAALLEDAVCLRFVEDELATFAAEQVAAGKDREALRTIVAKTWAKMSTAGRAAAPALLPGLPSDIAALVAEVAAS
jgi:hypothetical protein